MIREKFSRLQEKVDLSCLWNQGVCNFYRRTNSVKSEEVRGSGS